jgi:phosphatidylinositol kinase/protein kinase (PI-3  family)
VEAKLTTPVSADAQVQRLIAEATDQAALAKMFSGWAPWL